MSFPLACKTSALCVVLGTMYTTPTCPQETFDSPGSAVQALAAAVRSENYSLFLSIAGAEMSGFWNSGEPERDLIERDRFLDSAQLSETEGDSQSRGRQKVYVGRGPHRFPAPLVYTASGWRFDGKAGAAEVTRRRILRNEAAILELAPRVREAQLRYVRATGGADGAFAEKIRSTPGKHDGLFWSGEGEEDQSPLGPQFAAAAYRERQPGVELRSLHGYYLMIVRNKGPEVRSGFTLIAWPAAYGVDGVRSFTINDLGEVYQKDLGPDTPRVAEDVEEFNPDSTWTRIVP